MRYVIIENPIKELEKELININELCFIKNNEFSYLIIDLIFLGIKELEKLIKKFPNILFNKFDKKDLNKIEYENLSEVFQENLIYDELYLINNSNNLQICTFEDIIYETENILSSYFSDDGLFIIINKSNSIDILSENCNLFNRFFINGIKKSKLFGNLLIIWSEKLIIKNIKSSETIFEKYLENDCIAYFKNNIIINFNIIINSFGCLLNFNDLIDIKDANNYLFGKESYFADFKTNFIFINKNNEKIIRKLDNILEKKVWFEKNTLFIKIKTQIKQRIIISLHIFKESINVSIPLKENEEVFTSENMFSLISIKKTSVYKIGKYLDLLFEIENSSKYIDFSGNKIAILFDSYFQIYDNFKLIIEKSCLSGNQIKWTKNGLFISVINMMSPGACEIYDINGYLIRKMYLNSIKQFEWRGFPKLEINKKAEINDNWEKYKTTIEKKVYNKSSNTNLDELRDNWVNFLLKQKKLLE